MTQYLVTDHFLEKHSRPFVCVAQLRLSNIGEESLESDQTFLHCILAHRIAWGSVEVKTGTLRTYVPTKRQKDSKGTWSTKSGPCGVSSIPSASSNELVWEESCSTEPYLPGGNED